VKVGRWSSGKLARHFCRQCGLTQLCVEDMTMDAWTCLACGTRTTRIVVEALFQ
jgi:hypothetical protein